MRPIKKGEEVSFTIEPLSFSDIICQIIALFVTIKCNLLLQLVLPFGKNWLHDEKSERMSYLMASRSITCDCVACANDWPMLEYQKTYQVCIFYFRVSKNLNIVLLALL